MTCSFLLSLSFHLLLFSSLFQQNLSWQNTPNLIATPIDVELLEDLAIGSFNTGSSLSLPWNQQQNTNDLSTQQIMTKFSPPFPPDLNSVKTASNLTRSRKLSLKAKTVTDPTNNHPLELSSVSSSDSSLTTVLGEGIDNAQGNHSFNNQLGDATGSRSLGGSGNNNPQISYQNLLALWLAKHRYYPREARIKGLQGDALFSLRINYEGELISYQLSQSSGSSLLDRAAIKMLNNALPFPPFPKELEAKELELIVPVAFKLNPTSLIHSNSR